MDQSSALLTLSPSPHVKHKNTTQVVMRDVLIALFPAFVWSIIRFGIMAAALTVFSVALCVFFEYAYQKIMKKPVTVSDLSAAVTGVLIAFNLPVTFKPWLLIFGCFFAIVIVKQLFGGIGKNIVNPAIAARIFMFVSWPEELSTFPEGYKSFLSSLDGVTKATPLASIGSGSKPEYSILDSFLGTVPGSLGEVSALLLTVGLVYLLVRRVITWHIPVAFIGTVAIFALIFPLAGLNSIQSLGYQAFSGGLFLGAIFMATDYTTSPVTKVGRLIYGFGCGLLTVAIRYLGAYPEGVSFAIMIMNLLVWYIDRAT
ncbi:MAG: RnfABCDGE type electron transport complex subunit D, partial [Clostridia bacterium]|nr:RnfABCDGE type electron transport complex subunit D [Clostridia bacterium]